MSPFLISILHIVLYIVLYGQNLNLGQFSEILALRDFFFFFFLIVGHTPVLKNQKIVSSWPDPG